jgi:integrase
VNQVTKISEAMAQYMAIEKARRGERVESLQAHLSVLPMFLRISGDRQLANLTPVHVEKFFYGPGGIRDNHVVMCGGGPTINGPVSNRTHNHYRNRLGTFFKWCQSRGYLKKDVMTLTRPMKVHKTPRAHPEPVQLLQFLEVAKNPRDRAFIATAINTGLRGSEMVALTVGDINLEGGWIAATIYKTGDADDQPISLDLENELRRWLLQYAEDLGRPLEPEDYLFPNRTGGLISHYESTEEGPRMAVRHPMVWLPGQHVTKPYKIVQQAMAALGMKTEKEGTHTLRRAIALAYFQEVSKDQGDVAALRETAALLHHSSVATTEIYLGMSPEKNRRNNRIKGKPFLSAMVSEENGIRLAQ